MDFSFSRDQLLFQDNVRSFLINEVTPERIRELWLSASGRSDQLWAQLADLGLTSLTVPQDVAMTSVDVAVQLEQLSFQVSLEEKIPNPKSQVSK